MKLDEFKLKMIQLKDLWVLSHRNGPTGVGKTLEDLLDIKENNLILPDLGNIELKAHRENSNNMITLFTFNRKAWVMDPLQAIRKYGTKDKNGRLGLYFTMDFKPNSSGLYLYTNNDNVMVMSVDGNVLVKWNFEDLQKQFEIKIPSLILVTTKVELRGSKEYFRYYKAELLKGTSKEIIKENIREGKIFIDLRLHDKGTMARNHGTGFRTYEKYLSDLFKYREVLI